MTAYTSTQSGGWHFVATWGGGGVPGNGDTATIANGHVVEIHDSRTVGTSPTDLTTFVVLVQTGGTLAITDSSTFTVKGNIKIEKGAAFTMGTLASPIPANKRVMLYMPTSSAVYRYWYILNNGTFSACGAPAYHMADAAKQRAKLTTNVTAGAGVQFTVDANVDWQVDDLLFFGSGGKKDANFPPDDSLDRVQIDSKISANTYTAMFMNDHKINDFVVHANRNVSLRGEGTNDQGLMIYSTNVDQASLTSVVLNIDWAYFIYGSQYYGSSGYGGAYSALRYILTATNRTTTIPSANIKINNSVFDIGGGLRWTGYSSTQPAYIDTGGCYTTDDTLTFSNNHIWDNDAGFVTRVPGKNVFNNFSLMAMSGYYGYGVYLYTDENYPMVTGAISGLWCCGNRHTMYYGTRVASGTGSYHTITNCEIHRAYSGFTALLNFSSVRFSNKLLPTYIENCNFYHIGSAAISDVLFGLVRRCEFWYCGNLDRAPVYLYYYRDIKFSEFCQFNACNTLLPGYSGAVWVGGYYTGGTAQFILCQFGRDSRNTKFNISLEDQGYTGFPTAGARRVVTSFCEFREPISWPGGYSSAPYYTKSMHWSVGGYYYTDYRYRFSTPGYYSVQWVEPTVQTSSLTDQWAADYPNCSQLTLGPGGGESRQERTNVINSSFNRKMLPFWTLHSMCVNRTEPIIVPVKTGRVVTCKLSFKKNADGLQALPGLWLYGAGIDSKATVTPGLLNTWEELTVSGTATSDGLCRLYVFAGSNISHDNSTTWVYPGLGPPPGNVSNPDVMYDVTVYADKLVVEAV